MTAPTREFMDYWADAGDNRFQPIIRELVEAAIESGDRDKIKSVANRLKFLSSSMHSYAAKLPE